jgi:hypothetical protein
MFTQLNNQISAAVLDENGRTNGWDADERRKTRRIRDEDLCQQPHDRGLHGHGW